MKEKKVYCGYVYRITNIKNGKVYIGKTTEKIVRRFKRHYYDSKKKDMKINRAIRKYGIENFLIQELHEVSGYDIQEIDKELSRLEVLEIKNHNSLKFGYNSTIGGDGTVGRKMNNKNKKKMFRGRDLYLKEHSNKSVDCYDEDGSFIKTFISISEASRETGYSRSSITKCCKEKEIYKVGLIFTFEKKQKGIELEEYKIGKHHSNKRVAMYDLDGFFVKEYESVISASKENDINNVVVIKNCKGVFKKAGKNIFRYVDERGFSEKIEGVNINKFRNRSPIACYKKDGTFIKNFPTIKSASEELGINSSIISMVCSGKNKSAYGYKFRYLNDEEKEKLNE